MANAKEEFLRHIKNSGQSQNSILCAGVNDNKYEYPDSDSSAEDAGMQSILTTGWVDEDWDIFIKRLDFEYDSGYGGQELFGNIWYTDGTWSSRGEYDGSEWWEYHVCPDIPEKLNRIDKVRDKKINTIIE